VTTTLGINCAHDAAAALIVDGRLVVAVAEERLQRVKHYEGFPRQAIDYCLAAAALPGLQAVDCVVVNEYPETDHTEALRRTGYAGLLRTNPSHHLLHALYATAASGWDETAVMILDGSGYAHREYVRCGGVHLGPPPPGGWYEESHSTYTVSGDDLTVVAKSWGEWEASSPYYRFPSLGHMFSMASQYIFGSMHHAGKTMGLAPFGNAAAIPGPFVTPTPAGVDVRTDWIHDLPPRSDLPPLEDRWCVDLAAKVQLELEGAVRHLVAQLHEQTGLTRLCVSGGVALNSVTNGIIRSEGPFEEVFVTPAAGDSGVAVGAALHGYQLCTGTLPRWGVSHDSWGRTYTPDEVRSALEGFDAFVEWSAAGPAAEQAAEDLEAGRIVGWFAGGGELGPRALGHRSILADPRRPEIGDRLTERVKFREPFRPYAASVLAEEAAEWFAIDWDDPFMLSVSSVRPERRDRIPNVCHVDGTCRLQTVPEDDGGPYRAVIAAFAARTGVPLVLNTSFNIRGEPMVETPEDALRCYLGGDLDVLYLDGVRVTKIRAGAADPSTAVVVPAEGIELVTSRVGAEVGWSGDRTVVVTRTGHRSPVDDREARLLGRLDGATLGVLVDEGGPETITLVEGLQRRGLVWVARR
jgi:carbamoyltransferase